MFLPLVLILGARAESPPESLTFTRLVVRAEDQRLLGQADETYRVQILEDLRARGFVVKGAENLLFNRDDSGSARYQLGGTVTDVRTVHGVSGLDAEATIEWQVLDTRSDQVVYKVVTQGRAQEKGRGDLGALSHDIVAAAVSRLAERPKFREALRPARLTQGAPQDVKVCPSPPIDAKKGLEPALDASVLVKSGSMTGSGVLVSPDGFVLTAAHLVDPAQNLQIRSRSGLTLDATPVRFDPFQDVALVKIPGSGYPCMTPAMTATPVGAELWAVGAPLGEDLAFSVSRGVLSGERTFEERRFLQTDASINPGNSGGPLVDTQGRLVAVVSWKIAAEGFEGLGFGVPLSAVQTSLGIRWADTSGPVTPLVVAAPTPAPDVDDPPTLLEPTTSIGRAIPTSRDATLVLGGLLAASGGVLVLGTRAMVDEYNGESPSRWQRLVTLNTVGWVAVFGGTAVSGWSLWGAPGGAGLTLRGGF